MWQNTKYQQLSSETGKTGNFPNISPHLHLSPTACAEMSFAVQEICFMRELFPGEKGLICSDLCCDHKTFQAGNLPVIPAAATKLLEAAEKRLSYIQV